MSIFLDVECPRCAAPPGDKCRRKTARGVVREINFPHADRRKLAMAEHDGPQEGETVYLDAQTYRVAQGSANDDLVRLRIRVAVVRSVRRQDLRYDVQAGMWRSA